MINIQKYALFLYNSNEKSGSKKINSFKITACPLPPQKPLGVNQAKDLKDLYVKNYKSFIKGNWRWKLKEN